MDLYLDIDWIKKHCEMIHYFGLGFIQVKLTSHGTSIRRRMHFYHWKLPPITDGEEVHNHRYNFCSTILRGNFSQELYQIVEGDSHLLEKESCKAGVEINEPGKPCGIASISSQVFSAGSSYCIDHKTFHKVQSRYAVTMLTLGEVEKDFAEVVRPRMAEKVCPFSKNMPEGELWEFVEKMARD